MAILRTLGPKRTDAYHAACDYQSQHPDLQIVLHQSFEDIYQNLAQFVDDYFLVPTAFYSAKLQASWGQLHYHYLQQLTVVDNFQCPLQPLILLENTQMTNQLAYTHAATAELLRLNAPHAQLKMSNSKYQAYQDYLQNGQYVLTSLGNVTVKAYERIIAQWNSTMIWCVYRIVKE